ncbi:hypothetical protein [Rhodococcus sp. NPDC003322]
MGIANATAAIDAYTEAELDTVGKFLVDMQRAVESSAVESTPRP